MSNASGKAFKIIEQSDPFDFLSWLLNDLHRKLKKKKTSIIHECFKGIIEVSTTKLPPNEKEIAAGVKYDPEDEEYNEKNETTPFLVLPLDVPPPPLFSDELEQKIIPQVNHFYFRFYQ